LARSGWGFKPIPHAPRAPAGKGNYYQQNLLKAISHDILLIALEIVNVFPGRSGELLRNILYRLLGAEIGSGVRLQNGMCINGFKNLTIGDNTTIMSYGKIFARGSNIQIGSHCSFNMNVNVNAGPDGGIKIGSYVLIGPNTVIRSSNHAYSRIDIPIRDQGYISESIEIGDDVWIGANCVILPNVKICSHAIVAAGAVVNKDVAEYDIVGGVPSKKICSRIDKRGIIF
jgi:galactoside O-acetyltransferase